MTTAQTYVTDRDGELRRAYEIVARLRRLAENIDPSDRELVGQVAVAASELQRVALARWEAEARCEDLERRNRELAREHDQAVRAESHG